ncbi:hypothetical protein AB0L64_12225 [Kribbella sp. NPDC051936]|uniref:hypothetical protein n=1 Tax=Kribbella sp. NPDC051936 TaxID=3154946 RepID=UPI00343FE766
MAGIDIVTGPAAVGLAGVGVRAGDAGAELDGAGFDGVAVVGGSVVVGGAELVDGRGDSPDGATSLHPASASTTTRTPTSLTPRR